MYYFEASGIWKGRNVASWSIWKYRESAIYKVFEGPLIKIFQTDAPHGCIEIYVTLHIMKRRLNVSRYQKGAPFFNAGFTKGVPFLLKGYWHGPRGGASRIKRCRAHPPPPLPQTVTVICLFLLTINTGYCPKRAGHHSRSNNNNSFIFGVQIKLLLLLLRLVFTSCAQG